MRRRSRQHSYDRRPISLRTLCAIIRRVRETSTFTDWGSQVEVTKCELLRQGYDYPEPYELFWQAWDQVEAALERERKRQARHTPALFNAHQADPPWRGTLFRQPGQLTSIQQLAAELLNARPSGKTSSSDSPDTAKGTDDGSK